MTRCIVSPSRRKDATWPPYDSRPPSSGARRRGSASLSSWVIVRWNVRAKLSACAGWQRAHAPEPSWSTSWRSTAASALRGGADGISMINTILSVCGIDLKTLRPMPTVEGHSVPGGYSGQAVRPIALRQVMEVARANPGVAISGIGGIETGTDAAQFFLLGASTVQVCTGAMLRGYEIIDELKAELAKFMTDHQFANLRDFIGKSLPYFTTHHDLVDRQKAARDAKEAARARTAKDVETWKGDIAKETSTLVTN